MITLILDLRLEIPNPRPNAIPNPNTLNFVYFSYPLTYSAKKKLTFTEEKKYLYYSENLQFVLYLSAIYSYEVQDSPWLHSHHKSVTHNKKINRNKTKKMLLTQCCLSKRILLSPVTYHL